MQSGANFPLNALSLCTKVQKGWIHGFVAGKEPLAAAPRHSNPIISQSPSVCSTCHLLGRHTDDTLLAEPRASHHAPNARPFVWKQKGRQAYNPTQPCACVCICYGYLVSLMHRPAYACPCTSSKILSHVFTPGGTRPGRHSAHSTPSGIAAHHPFFAVLSRTQPGPSPARTCRPHSLAFSLMPVVSPLASAKWLSSCRHCDWPPRLLVYQALRPKAQQTLAELKIGLRG